MPSKIKVVNPVAYLDGDEMARVIMADIRRRLIQPFLQLSVLYFDLSIQNRDLTEDRVTVQAAEAINKCRVGIKCATITATEARVKQFGLKKIWKSPNATIRNLLNGTIFRQPIIIKNIPRYVPGWTKPIVIARHGFGDQYNASELNFEGPGELELVVRDKKGKEVKRLVNEFKRGGGIALAMYNTTESIFQFAKGCFDYALKRNLPMYLTTKNTILKAYDGKFKDIFQQLYDSTFKAKFQAKKIWYEHRLIDDMVAACLKGDGGFLWACKNYDGDVESDMVAQGFGSLGLMTSVLVSPSGAIQTEAAHGTITRHFRLHQQGKPTSSNPIASIFAWSQGLFHRARFDSNQELLIFAQNIQKATLIAVQSGTMTKDLAASVTGKTQPPKQSYVTTEQFIAKVSEHLAKLQPIASGKL